MSNWRFRSKRKKNKNSFNPNSDFIAEATMVFLKSGGKIQRLERQEYVSDLRCFENDLDFTLEGL